MPLTRLLYDLTAADGTRFSPYCWRVKLALAHKNLRFETVPWHFTDKQAIAMSGQGKVPVLVDGTVVVHDSQRIADYLEESYPNEESLFGEAPARGLTMFVKHWTERVLNPTIVPLVVSAIHPRLAKIDQPYFRQTREAALGRSMEELEAGREAALPAFQAALKPVEAVLTGQEFIAGNAPNWGDHIVFGALQWARLMSPIPLFEAHPAITAWLARLPATYGLEL